MFSSAVCSVWKQTVEYDRYEAFEAHVSECRFEQQRNLDSLRDFGVQRTYKPYTCENCDPPKTFNFDESASEKIGEHTTWHIEQRRKENIAKEVLEDKEKKWKKIYEIKHS